MSNVPYLRRDTTLLRLFHSLLVSAPLVVLHIYMLLQYLPICLAPDTASNCQIASFPSIYAAFGSSLATMLYSVLAFATNDRLSGKNRRVIFPAHLMQVLWYLCVLTSRMLAIALFAFAYNYYVFAFIGGHWLIMFLFLLIQKTTFCADVIRETDSKVVIKRRWYLEIPFDFVAATVYVFGFIGFRKGNTRYWAVFYHVLTYAEIGTMAALFYIKFSSVSYLYVFSLTALTLTAGLYPTGLLFMLAYYLFFHPKKTENWYMIGFPKFKAPHSRRESRSIGNEGFRNQTPDSNTRMDISGPVLVAHNGFIPRGMLPEDVPSSPGDDRAMVTNPTDIIAQSQRRTERSSNWTSAHTATAGQRNFVTSLTMVSPSSTGKSTTVASEALLPVILSDGPSDLGTDIGSSVLHVPQGEIKGDTVIDTPLFGNTPDPTLQRRLKVDSGDPGTLRSLTDTVDTGIDLGADTPLTQGTNEPQEGNELTNSARLYNSRQREPMSLGLDIDMPHFSDIPAKRNDFLSKKGPLETHYFPDSQCHEDLTPTLPTPSWEQSTDKSLLGHNSSGESGEMYQSHTKSSASGYRQHHILSLTIFPPEKTRRSTPRSPKGARAFTISVNEDNRPPALSRNNRTSYTSSYPAATETPYQHSSPAKLHTPRSPKGARRMMISQPKPEPIELHNHRHSFVNPAYHDPRSPPRRTLNYHRAPPPSGSVSAKTPDGRRRSNLAKPTQQVQKSHSMNSRVRSPERAPRGAAGYRRDHPPQRHSQYIQQQAENRSRWDKWAAEQEEKRRQANTEQTLTQSYPSGPTIPRNISEEFDHLEPMSGNDYSSADGASGTNVSASIAPQGYPRAPQGARGGDKPRFGWSPSRSDRISSSPQRSIVSGNASLNASLNASNLNTAPVYRDEVRLSAHLSSTGHYNKFYAPTRSIHQSAV